MRYKFFRYTLTNEDGNDVHPDHHWEIFSNSIGKDDTGRFAEYRGQKNAVLMHLRKYGSDFAALVGKHSTLREVTEYNEVDDETGSAIVDDDDYPNTPFICMPRLGAIACVEGSRIPANSAMSRIGSIIGHRQKCFFVVESIRESQDLRKAIQRFKITEVTFEIVPVNPHTGPLGTALDEARAMDHIRKVKGKLEAIEADPLVLEGGLLTQIQQLQQSGHARAGFKGVADHGIQVSVSKPEKTMELGEDDENVVHGEEVDVKVEFPGMRVHYPFQQGHVTHVRTIARRFLDPDE